MSEQLELGNLVQVLVQQQTALLQAHAETLRMQHTLMARLLNLEMAAPSLSATGGGAPEDVADVAPGDPVQPPPAEPGHRAETAEPPVLRIIGGTATRATRYYQEQATAAARTVTRQQIEALKRVQDTGPAGRMVVQFGKYKGQTLGAIALVDPDHVRWLSLKAQRPQVREAARQVLASTSSRQGRPGRASAPR